MEVFPTNRPVEEVYQYCSQYISMGLLSQNGELAYGLGFCKEYVLDYTLSAIHFPADNAVYLEEVRLVVGNIEKVFLASLELLHLVEDKLNIPKTVVNRYGEKHLLFRGNKRWFIAPPMLSLYPFIIRIGRMHQPATPLSSSLDALKDVLLEPDKSYLRTSRIGIDCILQHGDQAIFGDDMKKNWPRKATTPIHSRGIVSFSTRCLRVDHPDWYTLMPAVAPQ